MLVSEQTCGSTWNCSTGFCVSCCPGSTGLSSSRPCRWGSIFSVSVSHRFGLGKGLHSSFTPTPALANPMTVCTMTTCRFVLDYRNTYSAYLWPPIKKQGTGETERACEGLRTGGEASTAPPRPFRMRMTYRPCLGEQSSNNAADSHLPLCKPYHRCIVTHPV